MSAISTAFPSQTRRAYVSMKAFHNDIYSYTTSSDIATGTITYSLDPLSGATASNCPQGRFLYENGKKLYPGANPDVTTFMVGVYDPVSFFHGYIDPNSPAFTLMNTDKTVTYTQFSGENLVFGKDPTTNNSDLAPPVYTRGDLLAGGNMDLSGNAKIYGTTSVAGNLDLSGNARIYGSTYIGGELVNTLGIGAANVEWVSGANPASEQGALYSGNTAYINYHQGVRINNGTGTQGAMSIPRVYGYGAGQDLHISATMSGVTPSGVSGDLAFLFVGAAGSYPTHPYGSDTGIVVEINDRTDGGNLPTVNIYNNGTLKTTYVYSSLNFNPADTVWRQYDIVIQFGGPSSNTFVSTYINGVLLGKTSIAVFTPNASAAYVGAGAFSGSDNSIHYIRSLTVKPARSWLLTH
jgi:hypothetical protein